MLSDVALLTTQESPARPVYPEPRRALRSLGERSPYNSFPSFTSWNTFPCHTPSICKDASPERASRVEGPLLDPKPFPCHTCKKVIRNSNHCHTSKTKDFKPSVCHTSEKTMGGGGPRGTATPLSRAKSRDGCALHLPLCFVTSLLPYILTSSFQEKP
jgi:hypothetical protein